MTQGLQKLGIKMFELKWWVVLFWLVVLGALAATMMVVGPKTSSSLSIPGTQAQKTLDRFNEVFPDQGASSAKIVLATPDGKRISDYADTITKLGGAIADVDEVTTVVSPFDMPGAISSDESIAFITVQLKPHGEHVSEQTVAVIDTLIDGAAETGLTVVAGGDLLTSELGEVLGVGEVTGVVIALIVLVITLGSLVAAGLPLVIAVVTVGVSMAGLFSLSSIFEVTSTAPVLAVMLGLAVGIDYSLFIVNRYRTYVKEGFGLKEAAGRAVATAGNAVIFAAVTVVIALAALSVVQIPFMTTMGLAAAATVALAAVIAVTLIPALLSISGWTVFSRKERTQLRSGTYTQSKKETVWHKVATKLVRYRLPAFILSVAVIALLALPIGSLRLGLPTAETAAEGSAARQSYDLLAKGFGAGYNSPLLLVVEDLPAPSDADKAALQTKLIAEYEASTGLPAGTVGALPTEAQQALLAGLEPEIEQYLPLMPLQAIAERVGAVDGVSAAQAALVDQTGSKGVIQVIPTTGPSDQETVKLVERLRSEDVQAVVANGASLQLDVTGTVALQIDIDAKLAAALPLYLGVVVGLSFIILMVAFRSILIPIKATLGFLLSVFAMFGALVAIFQWGWLGIAEAPGPIVSFIPIIATGILFGLAMDYEFFLVSSMQEAYHHGKTPKEAVIEGFSVGSRVVVAAGLIMVAVFAGFIANHDTTIQSIGFALAIGVLVDAFIVRLVIVPVVMTYLGKSAWWIPKWLDKILPRVSIEGDESALKK